MQHWPCNGPVWRLQLLVGCLFGDFRGFCLGLFGRVWSRGLSIAMTTRNMARLLVHANLTAYNVSLNFQQTQCQSWALKDPRQLAASSPPDSSSPPARQSTARPARFLVAPARALFSRTAALCCNVAFSRWRQPLPWVKTQKPKKPQKNIAFSRFSGLFFLFFLFFGLFFYYFIIFIFIIILTTPSSFSFSSLEPPPPPPPLPPSPVYSSC